MKRAVAATSMVLSLAGPVGSQVPSTVTLHEVEKSLAERGARPTVQALFDDVSKWDAVLDRIATGHSRWLAVAQAFEPAVDAHTAETLVLAVAEALTTAPGATLRILHGPLLNTSRVCTSYGFLEYREDVTDAQVLTSITRRVRAVRSVSDSRLADVRKECLTLLTGVEADLRKKARGGA